MKSRNILFTLLSIVALTGLAISINNSTSVQAHKDKAVDQTIEMTWGDFFYQVKDAPKNAPITVTAGQLVRFVIFNEGELVHEMHLGRQADPAEQIYDEPLSDMYDSVWLEPEQSTELWIRIPDKPGEWELACFHEEHYNAGMTAKLIIQPKP